MGIKSNMRRHHSQVGVSAGAYRTQRLALFRSRLVGRRAVLLDINYWIELEKAQSGTATNPVYDELLALLREKVAAGAIFCPTSTALMMELAKQEDRETRAACARLMDALSERACLLADDELVTLEIEGLLTSAMRELPYGPPRHAAWAPVGCVQASVIPPPSPFPQTKQDRQRLEKVFFDDLVAATVEQLAGMDWSHDPNTWRKLAERLTIGNKEHQHELAAFKEALSAEAIGGAEACGSMIANAVDRVHKALGLPQEAPEAAPYWVRLIGIALGEKLEARAAAPLLFVRVGLHALLRWNKGQKYKPNDTFDFGHAAAALGYCDLFLTEGPLKSMLTRGPLHLEAVHACRVVADPKAALAALADL
jgi:hypothetical protein